MSFSICQTVRVTKTTQRLYYPFMHERYIRLLEAASMLKECKNPAEVARLLNVSDQVMTNWKSRGVPDEKIVRISKLLGCRPFWLESGEGDMVDIYETMSRQQIQVVKAMQLMPEYKQEDMVKIGNSLTEPNGKESNGKAHNQ